MWKACPLAVALLWLLPGPSSAVEIKNLRAAYGAIGAARDNARFQPQDIVCLVFDIADLKVDKKKNQVNYKIGFEFISPSGKVDLRQEPTPLEAFLGLGGNSVPGVVQMDIKPMQAPGKYKIKVIAVDSNAKTKVSKDFPIEVVAPEFGIVAVVAEALTLPGAPYKALFHFVNMPLDSKKRPNVHVAIDVLDDAGKPVVPTTKIDFPEQLPADVDLQKGQLVPQYFPIVCNRAGRFTIVVNANDKVGKKKAQLRIPLTVVDLSKLAKTASVNAR